MKIKIYQIGPETDRYDLMFMNLEFALKKSNGRINESTYELVYEGELKAKNLEDVFFIFNNAHPAGYRGRSLSTSDIVEVEGAGAFFCDSFGFQKIKFDGKKCKWRKFDG